MARQEHCQDCDDRHNCQNIYQMLGSAEGPCVVSKVILAFLLPMLVFVASLAASEQVLAEFITAEAFRTVLSFLLALAVTLGLILIIRAITARFTKNK
jgi:hypothetical protein